MASLQFPGFPKFVDLGDCKVKEGVKIPIYMKMSQFLQDQDATELAFPASFTSEERKFVHLLARYAGLKSKSTGKFPQRAVTVMKKKTAKRCDSDSLLELSPQAKTLLKEFSEKFPLTDGERTALTPREERGEKLPSYVKDGLKPVGRLVTAIPQVPRRGKVQKAVSEFRASLPIAAYSETIVDLVEKNQVVIVTGETGCGKTTQLPQILMDDYMGKKKEIRMICTQPRRLSAISVAERVAMEMGEPCGIQIGYMIRLETKCSPTTILTFCTTGVLTRTLMSNGEHFLKNVTHVILDEVHERERNCDFLLTCLKQAMDRNRNTKFILMSATVNTKMSTYFGDCPILSIPGRGHSVREVFLEEVLSLTKYTNPTMEELRKKTRNSSCDILRQWISRPFKTKSVASEHPSANGGCPGESSDDDVDFVVESDSDEEDAASTGMSPEELERKVNAVTEAAMETGGDIHFAELMKMIKSDQMGVDHPHSVLGVRALMCAAYWGRVDEVQELLRLGASSIPRTWGPTTELQLSAYDWAKLRGHSEIVEILAEATADGSDCWDEELVCLQKRQRNMDDEMKINLSLYIQSVNDDFIDTRLLLELLLKIHRDEEEGAVLVFLPGYEQIMSVRDAILADQRFSETATSVKLFVLHSSIQSVDQAAIFKPVQKGQRKVILSTNIAETSITISDVVHVVDCGKVKEKQYEIFTGASTLRPVWISKAAAIQRAGRAGRCRAGVCYRLYSSARFEQMDDFQTPEILRTPLQELCLQAKALMIDCPSVAEFLGKAPDPPSPGLIRDAITSLKNMGAMDEWEDLTELGSYLLELPLEPRLGKMVLYALELKCLDPILTIVCCLAVKDPFKLPRDADWKRLAYQGRQKLAEGAFSDHLVFLRAFQQWESLVEFRRRLEHSRGFRPPQFWSKAKAEGRDREKRLVDRYFINLAAMEEVSAIRSDLVSNLRACGLIRCRNAADIRALNVNSDEWPLVKFVLASGFMPNLARVITDGSASKIEIMRENRVKMHPSSIVKPAEKSPLNGGWPTANAWFIFEEMSRRIDAVLLRNCDLISPATVVLLYGPMRMSGMIVQQMKIATNEKRSVSDCDESDSEVEKNVETEDVFQFSLDSFVQFKIDRKDALALVHLRQKFNAHMLAFLKKGVSTSTITQGDSDESKPVIRALVEFLREEEKKLNMPMPLNIGTKPKAALSDCYSVPSVEEVGGMNRKVEDTSESYSSWDKMSYGEVRSGGAAYFVVKVNHHRMLQAAKESKQWAFHHSTEKKLLKFIKWKDRVFIFLNNLEQGVFHGCIYVVKNEITGQGVKAEVPRQEFCYSYLSAPYKIDWVCHSTLPHDHSRHLRSADSRRVDTMRDGQELPEPLALDLLKLMRDHPAQMTDFGFPGMGAHGPGMGRGGGGQQRRGGGPRMSGPPGGAQYGGVYGPRVQGPPRFSGSWNPYGPASRSYQGDARGGGGGYYGARY